MKAVVALMRINSRRERGRLSSEARLRSALDDVDGAIQVLMRLPEDHAYRLENAAKAHQLAATLCFDLGDYDSGLDRMLEAEDLFEEAGLDGEDLGRFLLDFSAMMSELSVPDLPLQYAERSRKAFAAAGIERSDVDDHIAALRTQDDAASGDDIDRLRGALRSTRKRERDEAAQRLVVGLLNSDDPKEHVDELHAAMKIAFEGAWEGRRRHGLGNVTVVLQSMIQLYWKGIALPSWLGDAVDRATTATYDLGRLDLAGDLLAVRAAWLLTNGDRTGGLDAALEGVARRDEYVLMTETSLVRMLTGRMSDSGRQMALETAIKDGNARLAAELIESARLQVEPSVNESDTHKHPTELGRSRITGLRCISVDGVSALSDHYQSPYDQLAVEDMVRATGGSNAVWWGTWAIYHRLYWVLWLNGQWSAGVIGLAEGDALTRLYLSAVDSSPLAGNATTATMLAGPWCRSVAAEEELAVRLGEQIIPGPLQEALATAAQHDSPLSLVVSGNVFALLPVAILGFGSMSRGRPLRVLEGAVVRVAAPAVLTSGISRRDHVAADMYPLGVACVDPCGDLKHSRQIPRGARVTLAGHDADACDRPTLANLTAALSSPAGAPGLFYYSGHAAAAGVGGDNEDALVLADGELLSADMLFDASQRGTGPYFPSRCLISACSSSGAGGAGAGEWLGLAAAIISQGSRQVVATNWPIWDTPFTSRFDLELAYYLQRRRDAATALRIAQLEALDAWRTSRHDLAGHKLDGLPGDAVELPFPLIWAAYTCIGVTG